MVKTITTPPPVEQALEALRYLAKECAARPLIHDLVSRDVARWEWLTEMERRLALERAVRRVGALCPWTTSKRRVRSVARGYGIAI